MSQNRLPHPQPNECLIQSRKAKFEGGTVIAEDVVRLQEHRKRLSDPDGYRPEACGNCGHRVLPVHDYPERRPLGLLLLVVVRVIRFMCANEECKATWRALPGFLARHLWWAWRPIEQATMDPSPAQRPAGGLDEVSPPAQTERRWLGRLASSARQGVVLIGSRGAEVLRAVGEATGLNAARQELEEVYRYIVGGNSGATARSGGSSARPTRAGNSSQCSAMEEPMSSGTESDPDDDPTVCGFGHSIASSVWTTRINCR